MRLNINLASQPYEDARQFYLQWLPLLIGLLALALALGGKAAVAFAESRKIDREINEKEAQIERLNRERQQAEATLAKPENSGTRDRAEFLNAVFRQKAFSWTQVLMDLEKLMPSGLQVVSIKPQLNAQQQLEATIMVASERRDATIEFIRRLEMSPRFANPQLKSESRRDEQGGGNRTVAEISVRYIPDLTPPKEQR